MSGSPHLIRAAALAVRPWKNGGGDTREIAAGPTGAGLDTFDWRLSLARVVSDGPFSLFPGIDRTLTVLEGGGMRLSVEGRAPVLLGAEAAPYAFAGDAAAHATLTGAALVDCNVMTRRTVFEHSVRAVAVRGEVCLTLAGTVLFVVARRGSIAVNGTMLTTGDALAWEDGGKRQITLSGQDGEVLAVELRRLA